MDKKREKAKIERKLPPVETLLKGKFKGKPYLAKVVRDKTSPEGKVIKYDGALYKSMTAAAKAITKQSVNGWRFWKFNPFPATVPGATETLAHRIFFWNVVSAAPRLADIIGLIEVITAVRAALLPVLSAQVLINTLEKLKKVGFFEQFG